MTVPNLLDTWKVTIKQHTGTELIENVLHVTASTLASPIGIATEVGAAWGFSGSIKSLQSNQLRYDNISVQPYDGVSAPTDVVVPSFSGGIGGAAFVPSSVQTSWIVTLRTLTAGRSHRGRMFISGLPSVYTNQEGTQWDSSRAALHQGVADVFYARMNTGPLIDAWVVYSHKLNAKSNVSSVVSRTYLGSQRRRTR